MKEISSIFRQMKLSRVDSSDHLEPYHALLERYLQDTSSLCFHQSAPQAYYSVMKHLKGKESLRKKIEEDSLNSVRNVLEEASQKMGDLNKENVDSNNPSFEPSQVGSKGSSKYGSK